jgi:hypothetical protein
VANVKTKDDYHSNHCPKTKRTIAFEQLHTAASDSNRAANAEYVTAIAICWYLSKQSTLK